MGLIIHTDGGCRNKKGGWSYVIQHEDSKITEAYGSDPDTTNNRMELTGIIRALESIDDTQSCVIHSDSQYVVKGLTEWSPNWIRNNWRTASNSPVLNQDLWQQLILLMSQKHAKVRWVKGHAVDPFNNRADTLATMGVKANK